MSNKTHHEFQEKIRLLFATFVKELPNRMDEIEGQWNKLQGEWNVKTIQELHRAVYNLADSGKVFGFAKLSMEARGLEQILKSFMQQEKSAEVVQSKEIQQLIQKMKKIRG